MYEKHASIDTPSDKTVIWRYMNLEKVIALLSTRELFLCRLDKFIDPWEGVWPRCFVEEIRENWPSDDANDLFTMSNWMRDKFFVNCWHENNHESAALWDQYAKTAGLAICTTVGRLKESISDKRTVYIGRIEYLDYAKDTVPEVNLFIPPFIKRKSFQHENEIRVMFFDSSDVTSESTSHNHSLQVDLQILIQDVYLSPTLENWVIPHIKELLARYGLSSITPKKSDLYAPHVY